MTTTHNMKPLVLGLSASLMLSGGLGLAGLALAAGTAQAAPGSVPLAKWCPGDPPLSSMVKAGWDLTVCHDYYYGPGPDGHTTEIHEGVFRPPMCGLVPCGLFP